MERVDAAPEVLIRPMKRSDVETVLGTSGDPKLPPALDAVLIVIQ